MARCTEFLLARRHSKPGSVKAHTIIDSPADWTSEGLKGREKEFTYQFTDSDVAELVDAVDKLKAKGIASEEDVKQVRAPIRLAPVKGELCPGCAARQACTASFTSSTLSLAKHRDCLKNIHFVEQMQMPLSAMCPLHVAQEGGLRPAQPWTQGDSVWQRGQPGAWLPTDQVQASH